MNNNYFDNNGVDDNLYDFSINNSDMCLGVGELEKIGVEQYDFEKKSFKEQETANNIRKSADFITKD